MNRFFLKSLETLGQRFVEQSQIASTPRGFLWSTVPRPTPGLVVHGGLADGHVDVAPGRCRVGAQHGGGERPSAAPPGKGLDALATIRCVGCKKPIRRAWSRSQF